MEWLRKTVRFEGRPDLSGGGRRFSTDSTASGLEGARRAGSRSLGLLQDSSGAAHCCQLSRSGTGSFGNDADGEQLAMLFEDFRSQWATYVDDGADERKAIVSRENDPGRSSYESSNEATAEYPTVSKTPSQLRREEHEGIAFGAFEIYVKAFNLRFQEAETLSVAERNQILSIFLETPAFPIPIRRIVESPSPPPLRPARSFGFFLAAASASPPPSSATSATESSLGSAQVNRASSIGDHPHDPVVLVCTVLKVLVGKLRTVRLKRQGDESLDEVQLHYQLFLVVKHFEILSRYPGNKECFARHGGLETICSLLEEAVSMMLDLLSGSDGSGVTDREHVVENHVLNIIVWGLKVTQRCLDPEDRWQMYIKTGGEQMNEPGDSTDGSQLPVDSPTIVSLVGTIVKLISFTGTQSHRYAVRSQALNALSAAVIYSPRLARRHFLALDGVEKLCSHIGWPRFLLQNANETVEASNNQGLLQNPQLEFFCQLLALNVAQFLTRISLTCAKQLEDHGVWSRMAEVVQWTSYKRGTWLIGSDSTLQKQESLGALSHEFFRSPRAEEDEHFSKEEGDVGGRRWDCPQTFNEAEYLSLKLDKGTDDSSIGPPVLPGIIGRMSTEHLLLRSFLWSVCLQSGDPLVPENSVDQTPLSPPLLDPAREEYINQGEQPEDKSQSIGGNSERPTFIYLQRVVQMLTSMFSSDDGEDSVSTNANTKADDLMPHKQLFQRKLLGQEPSVHFPPVLQLFVASVIGDLLSDEDAVETVDGSAVNDGDVDDDAIDLDRDRRVKTLQTMEENATFELLVSRHFGFVARMSDNPYEHPLRQYVLQMLIVVGCQPRPGLLPNVTACRVLLHLLVNWPKVAENDDLLNGPIWALIELLCLRPEATKKSLLRLQCLDQLVPLLIDEQKVKGSQGSVGSRGTSDVVRTHVWSLMGLFDNLLERNSEMLIYLFADRQSLNVFFKLLPHPRATVSDFVCRHIMSILGVLPIKFPTLRKWPSTDLTASPMGSPIGRSPRSLSQIDSGSQPSQDTTTEELLLLYTEFFPQTIADKASFELQKRLLRGLRSLLKGYTGSAKERRTVQMALVDARAFEHLLGVLSVRIVPFGELSSPTVRADEWAGGRQIFAQLCEEVLLTITAVMADNRRAKAAFRDLQGYETIRIRVFVNGNWPPWRGFLNRMVGMLYDYVDTGYDFIAEGEIDDLNEPRFEENILAKAYLVRNPDVLDALISVYPHLDTPSQDAALDQLIFAAKTHDMNRVVFNQISFLPKLMNAVLPIVTSKQQVEKTMDLIETIALFSVSTADAKLILSRLSPRPASLMGNAGEESSASEVSLGTLVRKKIGIYERFGSQEKSELLLPFYYDQLCDSILTMIKKKEQNMDFFYFTGRRSGLALPKITRWPISTGYTFATWFKLDPVLGEGVLLEGLSNPRKRKGSTQSEHGQNPNQNEGARPFSQAGASNDSAARLFSMLTAQGNGAELFIMNDLLHYVVIRNGVTSTVAVSNFRLLQNKWYFVAVSHVGPLPWSAQSEVSIYLNGNIRLKAKMDFPAADVYNQCRIGARALDTQSTGSQQADSTASTNADGPVLKSRRPGEAKAGQSNVYKDHFFNCFAGQTTSVYFFDDSLGLAQLNGIYKLGMGYSLQFRTKDGAQTTDTIESSGSLGAVFDGTLYSKLHMHFHPSATKNNRTCFDVSPKAVNNKLEGYMMNTLSCATKCFRTSIHALGGIEILYPLAIHLDIPNATPPYISPESVDDSTRDLSVSRATLFLQLVASLLEDSIHQLHFAQLRGAKIAAMLLNYANPRFLKMITLDAIMTFAKALTDTDQRLEAYEALIFDMRLWAAAPFAVQKEYFEFLRHFIAGHFDTFRSKFGVSFYLDTLDLFYWYDPPVPNPGTKMVPNLSPSDIQRLVLTRPTKHQLRKLRQHIFGIIKEYIRDGIQSYEAEALIRVLWTQNNSLHVSEILELLTELIRDGPPNAEKLGGSDSTGEEDITLPNSQPTALADEILHSGGGLDMFAELLNHVEEDTRLRAILLMSTIVHDCGSVSEKWKKKLKFEEITLPTVSPSMNTLGSVPAISSSPSQHFGSGPVGSSGQTGGAAGVSTLMLFTSQLERFPLTELTYLALLEYAMGEKLLSSSLGIEGERSVKVLRRPHETPLTATFEAPAVFQIILELACRPQNADLRLRVVQDLLMLVDRSSTNCDRFRRGVPNWQTILLIHMIPVGAFKHLINLDTEPEPQIIYPGRAEDRTDENRVDDWNPYILDTNEAAVGAVSVIQTIERTRNENADVSTLNSSEPDENSAKLVGPALGIEVSVNKSEGDYVENADDANIKVSDVRIRISTDFKSTVEPQLVSSPLDDTGLTEAMERKVAELIVETFAILVMDAFETDRRAWRVVEEATAIVWYSFNGRTARSRSIGGTDIGRVHGISTTRALFLWLLKRVAYEVKHKQPQDFTAAKKENIHHLLLLTEEFLFNHHDLRDVVQRESLSIPTGTLADYPGSLSQASLSDLESNSIVTNLDRTAPSTNRNDMVVRMSYPVDECWELSQEYVNVLEQLMDSGMTFVSFSETNEKSHVRVGGLSRMLFRILLSALAVQEPTGREFATRHLAKLLKSQSKAYMQSETHPHILNVVGHIHEGYKIAVQATNHSAALPEILSLYYLTVKAWLDVLLQIKSEGNPLPVTELKQAIASVDSFAEFLKSSSRWAIIGDKALFPATKVVEDEYCRLVPLMTRRYARFIRHLIPRFNREEQNALRVMIAQQQALSHTLRRKKQEDTTRLIDRLTAMESERRSLLRAWTAVYREISQERGIWYLYDAESIFFSDMLPQEHWKLDRTENHLRMRRKLIQNYDFDDHMEASLRRDKSTMALLDSSPHMRPGKMLQEKKRSQLERIRSQMLSTKEGGSTSAEESTSILSSTTSSPKADTGKPTSLANRDSYPGGPSDDDGQDDWKFVDEDDIAVSIMGDSQDGGDKTPSTLAFSPFGLGRATGSDPQERVIFTAECDHIMLMTSVRGKLQITTQYISFIVDLRTMASEISEIEEKTVALVETEVLRDRRWPISALTEMYPRRYMLRKSALEFFFEDQTNHFFNFKTPRERARVATKVLGLKPPNLLSGDIRSPPDMLRRTTLTERWQKHEISNFEYLMHLNTISGRTYNDLTQYPVFPWVLRDYESDVLDLSNPDVYRDLSKPTGAMDEARLNQLLERYRNFEDPSGQIKKFLYGTHYSSAAATLFYLLRMEPFTSLHIALQGGKFDHPDRQFHSIHGSWISATTGNGDVKELIPEFFYLPDFLVNENGFNLGTKQTGPEVNDVVLPKWASSPEEFIRLHREALESDFVSQNLHNWIDLIWGYKQQGEEAVKANNVFYYLTYEGAIDIDSVKDPVERRSIEDQINNFGQTPSQLFKKPHPMRFPKKDWVKPSLFTSPHQHKSYLIQLKSGGIPFVSLCGFESSGWAWGNTGSGVSLSGLSSGAPSSGLSLVSSVVPEKLISIGYDLLVGSHRWSVSAYPTDVPFTFDPDVAPPAKRRLHSHLSGHIRPHSRLFATTRDGRHIISGGHWDGCFRITPIDAIGSLALTRSSSSAGGGSNSSGSTGYAADAVYGHQDIVTALALSEDGRVLVTGSKDTTVMSWELTSGELCGIKPGSQKVFFGHDDEVATVAVNIEHDLVVSGSKDGTCIIHTFYDARYVKTLRPTSNFQDDNLSAQMIVITKQGYIVVYLERTDAESLQKSTAEATAASGRATSGTSADDDDDDDDARMDAGKDDELARRRQTLRRVSSVATPNQYRGQRRGSVTGLSTPTSGEGSPHTSGPGTPSHSLLLAASLDANASFLHLYSINGKLLKDRLFSWRLNDLRASSDGYHLVAADDRGGICLLRAHSLQISHRFDVSVSVLSVALSHKSQFLFLGRTDGKLLMIAIDPKATLEDDAKSAKQLKDKELVEGESQ